MVDCHLFPPEGLMSPESVNLIVFDVTVNGTIQKENLKQSLETLARPSRVS